MTREARVMAIAELGFTDRQARFLELVMRHAGVCLLRQYGAFAGIVHGQKTRRFLRSSCAAATRRRTSVANRGRLYHIHHAGLYNAIGNPTAVTGGRYRPAERPAG
jgi:hypothetical protein